MKEYVTLTQFGQDNTKPSRLFRTRMYLRIITSYRTNLFTHWYHTLPKSIQVAGLSTTTIAVFLTVLIAYPSLAPMAKLAYYRATGKDDVIFQNYYNLRSQNALAAENSAALQESDQTQQKVTGVIEPMYYTSPDSTEIFITKTQTRTGGGIKLCEDYQNYYSKFNQNQLNEYSYFENYSKSVMRDSSGQILEMYVTNNDGSYEYRGGSYAILREMPPVDETKYYEEPVLMPESISGQMVQDVEILEPNENEMPEYNGSTLEKSSEGQINDTIPADSEFIIPETYTLNQIEIINGKEFLVYTTTYDHYCPSLNGMNDTPITSIQKTWVDPVTYQTYKDILYLKEENEDHLLYETITEVTTLDPSQKDSYFVFDINTEIKTIPYTPNQNITATWIDSNTFNTLVPTDTQYWTITYFSSMEANNEYYSKENAYLNDRSFYAPGEIGNYYYDLINFSVNDSLGNTNLLYIEPNIAFSSQLEMSAYNENSGNSLNISTYKGALSLDDIRNSYGLIGNEYSTKGGFLTINGQETATTVITSTNEMYYEIPPGESLPEPAPTGYAPDMPIKGSYKNYYHYLVIENTTYLLTISGETASVDSLTLAELSFHELNSQNATDKAQLLQLTDLGFR